MLRGHRTRCSDGSTSNRRTAGGGVAVERLVERNRVSKPLEGYSQNTQNVAALKRAREQDLAVYPGQDIEYVVVDDEKARESGSR